MDLPPNTDFTFGTKAETLAVLRPLVQKAIVPNISFFPVADWEAGRDEIVDMICAEFGAFKLVVRSSALAEDAEDSSMAGQFDSVLSVAGDDRLAISEAIDHVASSMSGNPRDQVLVQKMVEDVSVSGVIMTYDVARGAPYYCIDYDDESGRTDVVTSGKGQHKSLYVHRSADDGFVQSERIRRMLGLARELEQVTGCAAIDIEFGLDLSGEMHLFQVRRIVLARTWHPVTDRRVQRHLTHVEAFLEGRMKPRDGILGRRSILAIMPDWNPAEIIGTTPRPLARSLYSTLITDGVWATARAAMGYRDLSGTELMVTIGHHPYIDVRNSFNSFLPAEIPDAVGERLVNSWLDRLEEFPELHDKVEFDIVPTIMDFTFQDNFQKRYPDLLSETEMADYASALSHLTRRALEDGVANTLRTSIARSAQLARTRLPEVPVEDGYANLARAGSLIKLCRENGTLPFAISARHGFIAEALLRSAVDRGALDAERLAELKRSIETISGRMLRDFADVGELRMTREEFFSRYGHLRPGTYEITSLRYDERDELFQDKLDTAPAQTPEPFRLTAAEDRALSMLLGEANLGATSTQAFLVYCSDAIAARENVKFEFTKALSDALLHVQRWGFAVGLSREDLSYLEWPSIAQVLLNPVLDDLDRHFLDLAHRNIRDLKANETLKFAHIIMHPRDIYVATMNRSVPNFIGLGAVTGPVVTLDESTKSTTSLEGCVVCIENADPGFDWVFTKSPLALLTRFGGANSHMAVRCAELGLPAAIGCGDQIFDRISRSQVIELDCKQQILRPVHG
ncbi:MAG: PEP/pyruvate-binding domain-containing protein [Pseudomonadota bacterium]